MLTTRDVWCGVSEVITMNAKKNIKMNKMKFLTG